MSTIAEDASFKNFSLYDYIYIDKTEQIYKLIKKRRVFISRPRRFGKSLMLDTIGTLFEDGVGIVYEEGAKPSFKDTWIYEQWKNKKYPVLRLNFLDYTSRYDKFCERFCINIIRFAKSLNLSDKISKNFDPIDVLSDLFMAIDEKNKLNQENELDKKNISIVILVDEYDAPLTANINDPELYQKFQDTLRELYGIMKGKSCIRFLGITGVTRLKDDQIFSVGSDINDLSYHTAFSTITGFTREEIKKYYIDYINLSVSIIHNIPKEQITDEQRELFLDKLAEQYDGYCFDKRSKKKVFSTWSVNNFFSDVASTNEVFYEDYWYNNGGLPSILANYLKKHTINLEDYVGDVKVRITEFESPISLLSIKEEVLMCQTGYLTIRSPFGDNNSVTLGFPNKEVQRALESLISFKLFPNEEFDKNEETQFFSTSKPEEIINKFNLLMNSISYEEYQNLNERTIQGFLHAFMIGAKQEIITEKHTALGRSDIVVEYDNRRLVLELKYAETKNECEKKLQEAIKQIQNHNYGETLPNKEILKLALVFNGDQSVRQFTHFYVVK